MARRIHSVPALLAALIVCFMSVTGALLSLQPVLEQSDVGFRTAEPANVAELAAAVTTNVAHVDRLTRSTSGSVTAYSSKGAFRIDPLTGQSLGEYKPSTFFGSLGELHRSLFLGQIGRALAGLGALSLVVLSVSGLLLLRARFGGWRRIFGTARGSAGQRLHVHIGRLAVLGLLLSSLTGTYMSLATFGIIGDGTDGFQRYPTTVDGGEPAPIETLSALRSLALSDLRELTFPAADDRADVFTLTTRSGTGFVDQATGDMLEFTPNGLSQNVYELIYMLHTGQGLWWLGALLGVAALAAPALAVTGILAWWRRRRRVKPGAGFNVSPEIADVVILVGTEGNSTWGFARELHARLTEAGAAVHSAAMNELADSYPRARHLFVLTATYGDGSAPASATRFLGRIAHTTLSASARFAVLGLGDRRFAHYCRFAADVDTALAGRGMPRLLPLDTIDRQSPQAFAAWGATVSDVLGLSLALSHTPTRPRTQPFVLVGRDDYGRELQAPLFVLRFATPSRNFKGRLRSIVGWPAARFQVGDLVGILPPGSTVPRYYSLASDWRDGVLEICVRKQQGGACSEFLCALKPGQAVEAFISPNRDFHPPAGRSPLILIGAGSGIAPLVGFIRKNWRHRPIHLYFGNRDPQSDFIYRSDLQKCLGDGRLFRLVTAFSRIVNGTYVQDRIRDDAENIRRLVGRGAQIMVCGGREMAAGAMTAVEEAVAPLGLTVASLKTAGRYLEDAY